MRQIPRSHEFLVFVQEVKKNKKKKNLKAKIQHLHVFTIQFIQRIMDMTRIHTNTFKFISSLSSETYSLQ